LAQAIKALPEKQRNLIEQAYFGDLSHSEIAEISGLPLGTIKSRIRSALERLRHAMK
jgi:RNA polymerase sigma factor (sigma-70 family)